MINIREEIVKLIPEGSIGCELGVFEGGFSEILVASNKFRKLYLVDLFSGLVQSGDKNGYNVKFVDGQVLHDMVSKKFEQLNYVSVVRDYSFNFLKSQEDELFDFIYIDTSHKYEDTKSELELSWQKTKKGGIISGHDYNADFFPGVVKALDEFLIEHNISDVFFTRKDILKSYVVYKQ